MTITYLQGDLFKTAADIVIHQCNVTSTGVSGLARAIFQLHPACNTYAHNRTSRYGHADFFAVESVYWKYVGNLYSQYYPGQANHNGLMMDSADDRIDSLATCLDELQNFMNTNKLHSVALPYLYGCGLAGGDWSRYVTVFKEFAERSDFEILIVSLE